VLHHAKAQGFGAVLCAGCDTLPVPCDLQNRLTPGPAVVEGHWLLSLWPVAVSESLDQWLASQPDRSIRGFLHEAGARRVPLDHDFLNINTPEALAEAERFLRLQGL
jgi:molybdopterin-guanine dinucleotide biosynthesis protein A